METSIIFASMIMKTKFDEIGLLFLKRRKELGLTQQQLGEKVGVTKSEISKIENGRGITFSTINKISDALGVAVVVELKEKSSPSSDIIPDSLMTYSSENTFEFLVEYITSKVVEWIMKEQNVGLEEALLLFHNSETFDALCRPDNGMYVESPAFVYEIFQEELRRGTLRGMTE